MIKTANKILNTFSPLVMGIINTTSDSFYKESRLASVDEVLKKTSEMLAAGAAVIDIGGCSTRPGAKEINEEEELTKTSPYIKAIRKEFPDAVISIDTYRSEVARAAMENGADIINDISGGEISPEIINVAVSYRAPYVLTHIKGNPENMQEQAIYKDVSEEVFLFFETKIEELKQKGVEQIILDPGFGFAKNTEHNYQLLASLSKFKTLGYPILAGLSRKSMINKVINTTPADALNGTGVLNTIALLNGADILRVHDVKEAAEAVTLVSFYKNINEKSLTKH